MKLTVRTKLMLLGCTTLTMMGLMVLLTWRDANIVSGKIEKMKQRTSLVRASAEGDMMHDAIRGDVLAWLLASDATEREQAVADLGEHGEKFRSLLGEFEGAQLAENETKAYQGAVKAVEAYISSAESLMKNDREAESAITLAREDFDKRFYELEEQLEGLSALIEESSVAIADEAAAAPVALLRDMVIAACFSALVIGLTLYFITRSIITRTNAIREVLAGMGAGDLTKTTGLKPTDELGEVAAGVDRTRTSLAELLQAVQHAAQSVGGSCGKVNELADQLNTELQRQQAESSQVAAAVEELAPSVSQVSQQGTQVSESAKANLATSTEGSRVVDQTVQAIQTIANDISKTANVVNELGKRGEQIGVVVSTIDEIAEQTNLLALDAAIEAARAGEHGRGFAVVADEVRKLAERTQRATEEVAKSIRDM
jgi:methyl-accepting chemotaxis protein